MRYLLIMAMLLLPTSVLAETVDVKVKGYTKDKHYHHEHIRQVKSYGEITVHDKTVDTSYKKRSAQGAGVDLLIYETDEADLVGEYKYDWANGDHSAYAVIKTKKSVVDIIKNFFKKDKGD